MMGHELLTKMVFKMNQLNLTAAAAHEAVKV